MHASLLWIVASVRTAVEPTVSSIGTPLIVSLVSLPALSAVSNDGPDREAIPVVHHTVPSSQPFQPSPERPRNVEGKTEVEFVATSKDQEVPGSEAPEGKSLSTDINPPVDLETAYSIAREVGRMSESEDGTIVTLKGKGGAGPEAAGGKSLATDAALSIDLEAAFQIARGVGREWESMSALTTQSPRFRSGELYLKNHLGIVRTQLPDCWTAHQEGIFRGFLSIPFLLKDTITDTDCTWGRKKERERQWDLERQGDPEGLGFYIDDIINLGRENKE